MGGRQPEPLDFLSHYSDPRRLKPLDYLSVLFSVVGHLAVVYILVVNPHWVFYPLRYILPVGTFFAPEETDDPQAQGRVVTFLARNRPMYAPVFRQPLGDLYSAKETVSISRPPQVRPRGNQMPYSRGTTKEFTITEVAKQMPSSGLEDSQSRQPATETAVLPTPAGSPPVLPIPPATQVSRPSAMVVPPNPEQISNKTGMPQGAVNTTADAGLSAQKPPVTPPANSKLGLEEQKQQVFDNEESALRSDGSGFFDTRGFELSDYSQFVIDRIKQNWMIPTAVRSVSGRSTVIFYIEKDGQISRMRIINPSGVTLLDRAALNSILESLPFPPLPSRFPGEHIGAKLVFSYNEVRFNN